MNPWSQHLAAWDDVWADVQSYDAEGTRAATIDVFRGLEQALGPLVRAEKPRRVQGQLLPPKVTWNGGNEKAARVREVLSERLTRLFPSWYARHGWYVGNETFGSCFCCALPRALSSGPEEGARWVSGELEAMVALLREWAPRFEEVARCDDRASMAPLVEGGVTAMIDVMIEHQWLSESWYRYLDDGARWMVSLATGLAIDAPAIEAIDSAAFAFTSWTGPSPRDRARFAEHVALLTMT